MFCEVSLRKRDDFDLNQYNLFSPVLLRLVLVRFSYKPNKYIDNKLKSRCSLYPLNPCGWQNCLLCPKNFRFNDLNKPLKMVINEINTICNLQYRVGRAFWKVGAHRAGKGGGWMLPLRFRHLCSAAKTLTYLNSITKYFIPQKVMQHKQNRASLRKKW